MDLLFTSSDFCSPLRDLLHRFKYAGHGRLADYFAARWTSCCPFDPAEIDVIVPVPMPFWKSWRRGYNQSALLADQVARRWGKPVCSSWIKRRIFSVSQTKLGRKGRLKNAERGFRLAGSASGLHGKTVLLIDDICTTGATLGACSRLLKSGGASRVLAGAVARES